MRTTRTWTMTANMNPNVGRRVRRAGALVLVAALGLPLAGVAEAAVGRGTTLRPSAAVPALAIPALGPLASAACTSVGTLATCNLTAKSTTVALPGLAGVTVWGYTTGAAALTAPGGPTLIVDVGQTVTVNLTNSLTEASSLFFQGQTIVPDRVGAAANGGTSSYTFVAGKPGTFLYEAGLVANAEHQTAMGLHGALVVRAATANQAYDYDALKVPYATSSAYNDEAVLVLSEIDPALNNSANPAAFDMRNFAPKYGLINGAVSPNTAAITSAAGNKVLLRYLNAGIQPHSMALLGLHQTLVANDGFPYTYPRVVVADTISPGQTTDAVATIPAGATPGSSYLVYDASLALHNNTTPGIGGMLTMITLGAAGGGVTPPAVTGFTATAAGFSATVTSAASTVTAAEYYLDSAPGAPGTGTAATGSFGTVSVAVSGSFSVTATGTHVVQLRGQDATGAWGPLAAATFTIAATDLPPTTSALTMTPNPATTASSVLVSATATDNGTGPAIAAAEYTLDGGAAAAMTVASPGAATSTVTATIPAGLVAGAHIVTVRSRDASGNWSPTVSGTLTVTAPVDTTPPSAGAVSANPNPTNGAVGVNSATPAVRVSATITDTMSNVVAAEAFIDGVAAPAVGSGIVLSPTDGTFNALTENVYTDVPLSTISALANGNHPIRVRGKDAAGNWSVLASVTLLVDKVAPTITSAALTPSTIVSGAASVTLGVVAADTGGSGLAGGQYWIDGTTTPPGSATALAGTSATVSTGALSAGVHTVRVRMKDAAGNWSTVSSVTLNVMLAVNDARSITANTNASQTSDANAAAGVLANDQPIGLAGRTTRLASAPVRTGGSGSGTITITCQGGAGNAAATPAVGVNTVCTNGAYRVTLTGVGTSGAARQASKRGTYQFTYTEILNSVTTNATVTITVN